MGGIETPGFGVISQGQERPLLARARAARLLHNIGGHPQAWGVLNRVFSATVMYELYPGKTPTILTE